MSSYSSLLHRNITLAALLTNKGKDPCKMPQTAELRRSAL